MHAGEGRGDVYYQSYARDMTRGFIDDCAGWAGDLGIAAHAAGEVLIDNEGTDIQAFRLRMASGRQISAMTSSPRAFRSKGRPGDVAVVDEAAFVDDLDEVLKAALAFRTWGGRVRIISTHNGEASPFNTLCRDIREGRQPGTVQRVTLADALEQGLYGRIAAITRQPVTPGAAGAWEAGIRAQYGRFAAEELDCIPSAGGGAWITWDLVRAAEHRDAGRAGKQHRVSNLHWSRHCAPSRSLGGRCDRGYGRSALAPPDGDIAGCALFRTAGRTGTPRAHPSPAPDRGGPDRDG